jgi:hypothetical protein
VRIPPLHVDLPKANQSSASSLFPEPNEEWSIPFNVILERNLRTGKKTHGNPRLLEGGKAAREVAAKDEVINSSPALAGRDATECKL